MVAGGEVLTNGGNSITASHVNDAGPGGTGSFNSPFGSLNDAVGKPANVVLVHANTFFSGEQFDIGPNQLFLDESRSPVGR